MANILTLARIALIAPFAALFMIDAQWNMIAAVAIFALASLTDFFDGRIARARGEVSALGAAIDPLADKLLVSAALVLLINKGVIGGASVLAALLIILREILISGLREAVSGRGGALPVSGLAKWKTTTQIIAVGLLIAAAPHGLLGEQFRLAGVSALWLAALLTIWTGGAYSFRAVRLLKERRTE